MLQEKEKFYLNCKPGIKPQESSKVFIVKLLMTVKFRLINHGLTLEMVYIYIYIHPKEKT